MTTFVSSIANFGGPSMVILLLIVLLLFGAKRLPELARGLGQAMNEFNKAKDDMQRQIARADEPPVRRPDDQQTHQPAAQQTVAAAPAQPAAVQTETAQNPQNPQV